MKTLIIAEKPSVGRDIARVLKCNQKGDGFLHNNDYIISWAIGHLATLKEPEDYDPTLKKWNMSALPILPSVMGIKSIPNTSKQLNLLKKMLNSKEVSNIICATDSGREGELIFRYIYQWANCKKPVKRLWISSLTDTAIKDGLNKMKDGKEYDNLFASARCRAEADWLVGMNATRAYTIKCGELLPMGRVQTPTLAILVTRQHEINAFVPKDYWELYATFSTRNGNGETYIGKYFSTEKANAEPTPTSEHISNEKTKNERTDSHIDSKETAHAIAAGINNKTAIVTSIETEEKRQLPPQLFDLTELQREMNRKLGFSAQKTLNVAQSLYETHKMITYPRTDSRHISTDMIPKLAPILESVHQPYEAFAATILAKPKLPTTSRIVNDAKVTDHHAIIPTGSKKPLTSLSADERAVYDYIVRNFLAVFFDAYVYDVTTVITKVDGGADGINAHFRSRGKIDRALGWKALYAQDLENAGMQDAIKQNDLTKQKSSTKKKTSINENDFTSEETPLPPLTQGEDVDVSSTEVLHKKTKPPKPYTEATLLSAMEHAGRFVDDEALKDALKSSGLGTPATRANMIEKLISSGYVTRSKKSLVPTDKGIRLISLVPPEMRQPETTGKWEKGLSRIAQGELSDERFMESIRRYVVYLVEEAHKIKA